ncbi:MAG: alginate lyase family protein [Burkholderiaceae bacterium]
MTGHAAAGREGARYRGRRAVVSLAIRIGIGLACGAASAHAECPAPPPAVRDLDIPRYYTDARNSVVDTRKLDAAREVTAPLTAYVGFVAKQADAAVLKSKLPGRLTGARCALTWLTEWARAAAYLGRMADRQAEYQRKWDLAGLALAYLKVRHHASEADRRSIEPWLDALAVRSRAFFDDRGRQRNNHWYWLGLGLGATALATGSERHWREARRIMADAARDIARDGTLPLEMKRGARALHYHAFAVEPLVALAELARAKGEDFYGLERGALHRLVSFTARALESPLLMDRAAGIAQERPIKPGAGWAYLYARRFPGRDSKAIAAVEASQKRGHRWLGGSTEALAKAVDKLARPDGKPEATRPRLIPMLR